MNSQQDLNSKEWRGWSWSGVAIGVLAGLAILALLTWIGVAILNLPLTKPYLLATEDASAWRVIRTAEWFLLLACAPAFVGTWIAGWWKLAGRKIVLAEGLTTWALIAAIGALGYIALIHWKPVQGRAQTYDQLSPDFDALADKKFAVFLLHLAESWKPNQTEDPIYVSAKTAAEARPNEVSRDQALQDFLAKNTALTAGQRMDFLSSYRNTIAIEVTEADQRFEAKHAVVWRRQQREESIARALTWMLAISGILTLVAAFAGAQSGWRLRSHHSS